MTETSLTDLVNMEQKIVTRGNLCFYIRATKSDNPTMIYVTLYLNGKKYHVSIGLRVRPSQWDKSNHEAIVHPSYSEIDNLNNSIANAKILSLKIAFAKNFLYLCDVSECLGLLTKYNNKGQKMMRNRCNRTEVTQLMTNIARENLKDRSFTTERTKIDRFKRFLKNNRIPNDFESMTYATIDKFNQWLNSSRANLSLDTADQTLRAIKKYLKKLGNNPGLNYDYISTRIDGIISPKDKRSAKEQKENYAVLTHSHIKQLESLEIEDEELLVTRDLFLMQCYSGVRVSDLPQLLDEANFRMIDGVPYSVFIPKKTENCSTKEANIPLSSLYPRLYELYKVYKGMTFSFLPSDDNKQGNQSYNRSIRCLGQMCGWNDKFKETRMKGGKKVIETYPFYKGLSSHSGRHSFVTNAVREHGLTFDDIISITGHKDTTQITSTYLNLNHCDGAKILNRTLNEKHNKKHIAKDEDALHPRLVSESPVIAGLMGDCNSAIVDSVNEAKRVLNYLGANVDDYQEIDDFATLLRMICDYESKIIGTTYNRRGDLTKIKEIFNEMADIKVRKCHLHSYVESLT